MLSFFSFALIDFPDRDGSFGFNFSIKIRFDFATRMVGVLSFNFRFISVFAPPPNFPVCRKGSPEEEGEWLNDQMMKAGSQTGAGCPRISRSLWIPPAHSLGSPPPWPLQRAHSLGPPLWQRFIVHPRAESGFPMNWSSGRRSPFQTAFGGVYD